MNTKNKDSTQNCKLNPTIFLKGYDRNQVVFISGIRCQFNTEIQLIDLKRKTTSIS